MAPSIHLNEEKHILINLKTSAEEHNGSKRCTPVKSHLQFFSQFRRKLKTLTLRHSYFWGDLGGEVRPRYFASLFINGQPIKVIGDSKVKPWIFRLPLKVDLLKNQKNNNKKNGNFILFFMILIFLCKMIYFDSVHLNKTSGLSGLKKLSETKR